MRILKIDPVLDPFASRSTLQAPGASNRARLISSAGAPSPYSAEWVARVTAIALPVDRLRTYRSEEILRHRTLDRPSGDVRKR
jgi:hypothetical protein